MESLRPASPTRTLSSPRNPFTVISAVRYSSTSSSSDCRRFRPASLKNTRFSTRLGITGGVSVFWVNQPKDILQCQNLPFASQNSIQLALFKIRRFSSALCYRPPPYAYTDPHTCRYRTSSAVVPVRPTSVDSYRYRPAVQCSQERVRLSA